MQTVLLIISLLIIGVLFVVLYYRKCKETAVLKNIIAINKDLSSEINLKDIEDKMMRILKEEINCRACTLYKVDAKTGDLLFDIVLGDQKNKIKQKRLKCGEGIAGWVAKNKKSVNSTNVNEDERYKREISEEIHIRQKSMLTSPVMYKGEVFGVLQVIDKIAKPYNKKNGFDSEDVLLVEEICSQIAIGLKNVRQDEEKEEMHLSTISCIANSIDARDQYTNGHSNRVTEYALQIGKKMNLSPDELKNLEYMGILHDVGKIGIKDEILKKPGSLTDEEYEVMKQHPEIGYHILKNVKILEDIIPAIKYHHERYDGKGYPYGLKGKNIPLEARIISVADAYDAMTSDRPYRKGMAHSIAINEIIKNSGTQFDPEIAMIFKDITKS